jgi:two-component system, NarL family, sensor histidine kinase LiaS
VLDLVSPTMRRVSRRLASSYLAVMVVVVVLAEAFVFGYQAPRLLSEAQLHTQVQSTAASYLGQLRQRYPDGVPSGALLGDPHQPLAAGTARTTPDGSVLIVPAVAGTIDSAKAVTAVVAISPGGNVIASSAPSRYPAGTPAASALPEPAFTSVRLQLAKGVSGGTGATPYGAVSWTLYATSSSAGQPSFYLYVQAPQPTGFVDPLRAWEELGQASGGTVYATLVLLVVGPVGALLGLLAFRRLVRRVRHLERATVAVVDGDYSVALPTSGRGEVGRLEANVAVMAQQLSTALAAERERATAEARAAERSRIAREIHDAISQHLFALRMIASGMRRAHPHDDQVRAIERITEDALRDMQALLSELRPAGLEAGGLASALEQVCAAYRDRLGVTVDAHLADLVLPEPVEDALLRVAQEACTNAVRHGNAQRLAVSMGRRNGHVELAVLDNGTGFDPAAPAGGGGLRHIHDRVAELGGTVTVDSAPGEGTAVTVLVPAP